MYQKKNNTPPSSTLNNPNTLINNVLGFIKNHLRQDSPIVAPTIIQTLRIYPHRKAILKDYGGDMSKRWFIEYYQWHKNKEKLIRKRVYKGFDEYKTYASRLKYGKNLKNLYNRNIPFFALTDENTPEVIRRNKPIVLISLSEGFSKMIELKHPIQKNRKTHLTFTSICAMFEDFCDENGYFTHTVKKITPLIAQNYVDYMTSVKKYSPTTTLNHISTLHLIFNHMVKREYLSENPFQNVDKPKKVESKQNIAYTNDEIQLIKNEAIISNPQLWNILQVIYYTYLRPVEITRLKIEHILLDKKKIFVPGEISKNKKSSFLEIPSHLISVFEDLKNYPKHFYVFGKNGEPSEKKIGNNWMGRKHSEILEKVGITEKGKTLYSWKHTGVVEAYKNGIDIKSIQLQCRHHSIQQTDTYLKSLGFVDNDAYRLGVKEI